MFRIWRKPLRCLTATRMATLIWTSWKRWQNISRVRTLTHCHRGEQVTSLIGTALTSADLYKFMNEADKVTLFLTTSLIHNESSITLNNSPFVLGWKWQNWLWRICGYDEAVLIKFFTKWIISYFCHFWNHYIYCHV